MEAMVVRLPIQIRDGAQHFAYLSLKQLAIQKLTSSRAFDVKKGKHPFAVSI
jgi:hypothetical protein